MSLFIPKRIKSYECCKVSLKLGYQLLLKKTKNKMD